MSQQPQKSIKQAIKELIEQGKSDDEIIALSILYLRCIAGGVVGTKLHNALFQFSI